MQLDDIIKLDNLLWRITATGPNFYVATLANLNAEPDHNNQIVIIPHSGRS